MTQQSELDLIQSARPAPAAPTARRRTMADFAGYSWRQIALGIVIVTVTLWSVWVTRMVLTPRQNRIVSARLSTIVGDYVQAQARSATPPSRVEADMRAFMASLDQEVQKRSARGEIVLVGEAVLTKNVPDVTASLEAAVYRSGVARPRPASAAELERLQALTSGPAPPAASAIIGSAANDPMVAKPSPAAPFAGPAGSPTSSDAAPGAAATVSTFGRP